VPSPRSRPPQGANARLDEARALIARQQLTIQDLERQLETERVAGELREALSVAAVAGTIAAPTTHSRLLEMIVETAAQVIGAKAGSLFRLDEANRELVFEVALGEKGKEAMKFRVPLGRGVAGLVAVTGQPMAISDAQSDPRLEVNIAQSIGYMPQSLLCVPLFHNDTVVGVLELLDKKGAPSFSVADMELLSLFATQAAVAIEQSRNQQDMAELVGGVLEGLAVATDPALKQVHDQIHAFAASLEQERTYTRALRLARLVHAIAARGDRELSACEGILQSVADYLASAPKSADQFLEDL
jgi:GAF domain-containing protein